MLVIDHKPNTSEWVAMNWTGTHLSHVTNGDADNVLRRAGVPRQTVSDFEIDAIIRSSTTVTPCPPPWVNTSRGAIWSSARG